LTSCYAVKAGDVVLVHAAAGGVGSLMGQWLKSLGADRHRHGGRGGQIAVAKAGGYSHVIDYRAEDFAARVKDITGGKGCDVVYDSVANRYLARIAEVLAQARAVRVLRAILGADRRF